MRADLVEQAQRGDREAFGLLAAGEVERLLAVARLILRDQALAEDAVQEALVRCWVQRWVPFDPTPAGTPIVVPVAPGIGSTAP